MEEEEKPITEPEVEADAPDPDETPIRDRKVITQQYDLVVESLVEQIKNDTIFLRPLSARPNFQRKYVWNDVLASRLIESILLNVPIPPCFLSQNEDFELDVIDGQQRLYSIFRFLENQFRLNSLEVLTELNQLRYFELPTKFQRQIKTHTLRCVLISNQSHPEIKFDVFERLNTNTVPLNAQELRNCVYRGALNDLLQECAIDPDWLAILGKKKPDKRLRDEELVLRFFAFEILGLESYRTPQKHWLNEAAKEGRAFSKKRIAELRRIWTNVIEICLILFEPRECFRRQSSRAINRALFDLVCYSAKAMSPERARKVRDRFRAKFDELQENLEFQDLINRSVDHKKRTFRRFEMWDNAMRRLI